jgi:hypothetical protein
MTDTGFLFGIGVALIAFDHFAAGGILIVLSVLSAGASQ